MGLANLSGQCSFEVALSGGLDSTVLLHLLCLARLQLPDISLGAVHVHHGLSPRADSWAEHCQSLCANWDVPLRVERVCVETSGGQSLEAEARCLRYQAFDRSAAKVIVLAHHQDDQAETVMLQALRGGGVKAMAAMAGLHRRGAKWLWRPLLSVSRSQLEDYAREHTLTGWMTKAMPTPVGVAICCVTTFFRGCKNRYRNIGSTCAGLPV
ncbi:tRNA lysidine(34) synthetase TilS [Paludibacterium sp. dN 18-1]|uniref:tRNA(Ile)-lysidine synthase n=1 Tax=Paludibacterium denitrificans TaxID=2675226 RepID=A0A844GDJ8_9NEIS|nr:tRNA lysidine(34) synthetase TilS [Paludibacterium denitrificans]